MSDRLIAFAVYGAFVVASTMTFLTSASWFELAVISGIVSIHLLILDVNSGG